MKLYKKPFVSLLIILGTLNTFCSLNSQVLCVNCFHQNERVLLEGADLIVNGGFEQGCNDYGYICPNSSQHECDLSDWVCTGGGPETYASCISNFDPSLVVEGRKAVYFGNGFCDVCPSGQNTNCLFQTGCEVSGIPVGYPINDPEYGGTAGVSLEQIVYGLMPGANYELEFWAGGEDFANTFLKDGLFAVDVGFGKIYLQDPTTPANGGIGIRYVVLFKAISDSTTIRFTNWGHINFDATELIIDDVRLIKSNESGNPCSTSTLEVHDRDYIRLVPNPIHSTARFILNSTQLRDAQLIIYNSNGILVSAETINEESIEFNCNSFPSGIYYFQLQIQNQYVQTGKFIID